jgi:hypothetical protein
MSVICQGCNKEVDEALWHWDQPMTPKGSASSWVVVRQGSTAVAYIDNNMVNDAEEVARFIVESVNDKFEAVR